MTDGGLRDWELNLLYEMSKEGSTPATQLLPNGRLIIISDPEYKPIPSDPRYLDQVKWQMTTQWRWKELPPAVNMYRFHLFLRHQNPFPRIVISPQLERAEVMWRKLRACWWMLRRKIRY